MESSDQKAPEFERRASQRLSRPLSIATAGNTADPVDDEAYMAAMAIGASVSGGFRQSRETSAARAASTDANRHLAVPVARDTTDSQRPPLSDTTTANILITYPDSVDTPPKVSSSSSPASSPSSSSSSAFSPPSQPTAESAILPQPHEPSASLTPLLPRSTVTVRPSSIAKPPIDSASAVGAGVGRSVDGGSSSSHPSVDPRASASSSVPPVHDDEPYQGPSGPSFPYQMYPQNVRMARTPSGITAPPSVTESDSSYTGPRGPTFPYSMYPQNTVAGPSAVPPSGIPVGFPGMAGNYQRRIGPDGEDIADIIGPDGHTEQLPPYTRYPDEAYTRKIIAAGQTPEADPLNDPTAAPNSLPVAGVVPGSAPAPASGGLSTGTAPVASSAIPAAASILARSAVPSVPAASSAAAATASGAEIISSPATTQPIPGAGGLGLAPCNPEFDGVEDVESPRSRYSLRSFNSENSGRELNMAARGLSEKRSPNFIQRYGGRRMLGVIPYWAICLVITAIVLMSIILGSVIGTFVARHRKAPSHQGYAPIPTLIAFVYLLRRKSCLLTAFSRYDNPVSVTVTVDATPIPTPPNMPALPTGTFSLPLQKDEGPGACFNDTTQAQAWSCNIPYQYGLSITINSLIPTPGGPMYNISINRNESATVASSVFYYGEQAPAITKPTFLQLVNDTLDPNRGPAWFKMLPYNKTVVVHETFLSVPTAAPTASSNNKRDAIQVSGSLTFGAAGPFHRKGVMPAQVGDKPWVCTWPDTILEVFIYPNQNTSMYKFSLSSTYTPVSATPTPTAPPSTGVVVNGAAALATDVSSASGSASSAAATSSQIPDLPQMPPPYPRVVKVEERRMANSPQATCVQYELRPEGTGLKAVPNLDANGKIIEVSIAEIETGPPLFAQSKRDLLGGDNVFEERDVSGLSKCGCLWMVT